MPEIKGKIIICERCGEQDFLKCTGEGEMDGGFTRWNKFEDMKKGWTRAPRLMCPKCNEEYTKMMEAFWKNEN